MTLTDIAFFIFFAAYIALIVVAVIGCVRECQQAGDYDGR